MQLGDVNREGDIFLSGKPAAYTEDTQPLGDC